MENQGNWSEIGIGKSRRILVVDAAEDVRSNLALSLNQEGFQVSLAKNALEALRVIKARGIPDLVLLDIMLPEIDGFTLAYEIRKQSDVPIVVLSSVTDSEIKVAALLEFAEDYVTKPFHVEEVAVRIWRILTHYPQDRMRTYQGRMQKHAIGARTSGDCRMSTRVPATSASSASNEHRSYAVNRPCALGRGSSEYMSE